MGAAAETKGAEASGDGSRAEEIAKEDGKARGNTRGSKTEGGRTGRDDGAREQASRIRGADGM